MSKVKFVVLSVFASLVLAPDHTSWAETVRVGISGVRCARALPRLHIERRAVCFPNLAKGRRLDAWAKVHLSSLYTCYRIGLRSCLRQRFTLSSCSWPCGTSLSHGHHMEPSALQRSLSPTEHMELSALQLFQFSNEVGYDTTVTEG